jgi:predicted permease
MSEIIPFFFGGIVVFGIWAFFFVHAIQYIEDPARRATWALCFICFNILSIPVYLFYEYIHFYKSGKGGLIGGRRKIKNK